MKNSIFYCLIAVALLLTVSCQKDEEIQKERKSETSLKSLPVGWTYFYDGSQVMPATWKDNIAMTVNDVANSISYNFSTVELFYTWAANQNFTVNGIPVDFVAIDQSMNYIGNYAINSGADDYYLLTGTIRSDVQMLMDQMLPKFSKPEENKWVVNELFDQIGFVNQIHLSVGSVPNLGSARNRAESQQCFLVGITVMCDYTWFRGAKQWIICPGALLQQNLNEVGWGNRIESILGAS